MYSIKKNNKPALRCTPHTAARLVPLRHDWLRKIMTDVYGGEIGVCFMLLRVDVIIFIFKQSVLNNPYYLFTPDSKKIKTL